MNFTRTPNKILDLLPEMDKGELMLTMLLVRHTFGFTTKDGRHSEDVRLTFNDMAEALGVAKATINRAVGLVETRGIFRRGRRSYWHLDQEYSLNSIPKQVDNGSETRPDYVNNGSKIVQKLDQNSSETIPPILYKEKKEVYIHPLPEPIQEIITSIVQTVKTAYGPKTEDDFEAAAYTLFGWDATPDKICGFGDWWKANGYYKGKPALKSLVDEFRNYLQGLSMNQNGAANKGELKDKLWHIVHRARDYTEGKEWASSDEWNLLTKMGKWRDVRMLNETKFNIRFYEVYNAGN